MLHWVNIAAKFRRKTVARKYTYYVLCAILAFVGCDTNDSSQDKGYDNSAAVGNAGACGTHPNTGGITETATTVYDASVDGLVDSGITGISSNSGGDTPTINTQDIEESDKANSSSQNPSKDEKDSSLPPPLGTDSLPQDHPKGEADFCDRQCLIGYISDYLDALVARDPSRLKVSSTVKYTINGVIATLGDGLWGTASQLDAEKRLDFADFLDGQVATQTVVMENGTVPVIYQVRLKVVEGEITEIESIEVRQRDAANGFFNVDTMKPEPVFLQEIEPSRRLNRDELRAIMDLYMDYLEGTKSGAELPFDDNCIRFENGVPTASGRAAFEFQSWFFQVTRRYLIFDEEAGIAWGMFPFFQADFTLVVGEAFKIIDGKFMMIQAVMAYMANTEWD